MLAWCLSLPVTVVFSMYNIAIYIHTIVSDFFAVVVFACLIMCVNETRPLWFLFYRALIVPKVNSIMNSTCQLKHALCHSYVIISRVRNTTVFFSTRFHVFEWLFHCQPPTLHFIFSFAISCEKKIVFVWLFQINYHKLQRSIIGKCWPIVCLLISSMAAWTPFFSWTL